MKIISASQSIVVETMKDKLKSKDSLLIGKRSLLCSYFCKQKCNTIKNLSTNMENN